MISRSLAADSRTASLPWRCPAAAALDATCCAACISACSSVLADCECVKAGVRAGGGRCETACICDRSSVLVGCQCVEAGVGQVWGRCRWVGDEGREGTQHLPCCLHLHSCPPCPYCTCSARFARAPSADARMPAPTSSILPTLSTPQTLPATRDAPAPPSAGAHTPASPASPRQARCPEQATVVPPLPVPVRQGLGRRHMLRPGSCTATCALQTNGQAAGRGREREDGVWEQGVRDVTADQVARGESRGKEGTGVR